MLFEGKGSINDIDAFFVTAPPARTTLAPKRLGDNELPDLQQISEGSIKEDEKMAKEERLPRAPSDLKLVKLPPQVASTVAPFKHNSPVRRQLVEPFPTLLQPSPVRFPAQPWQIPPIHAPQPAPNPLAQFFQPLQPQQPQQLVPPPNPFFPQPNWTPPPLLQPNPIPQPPVAPRNDTFDPFVPIAVGQPPYQFPQPPHQQQQFQSQQGPAAVDFHRSTPPIDYSVDSVAVVTKDQRPPPLARSIPEKSSEQLRNFVKVHPHVMHNLQKPLIYRGKEMVIPKMFNFTNPSTVSPQFPPQPVSVLAPQPSQQKILASSSSPSYVPLMNPNQKLDLCCRKQRVGPLCQNLCNFDSFNDKTLVTAFLTQQCPGPQLGQAYDCASSKADHSQCCERAGLASFQGGKCMPFCRTHVATPSNVLDYFVCLQVFESIKGCYRDYSFTHPNIYGD
uniref:DB domain-containing protein n=1 Tax=Caenorhabditis japonica TaxID=281687 RepID=A0A8R1HT39_CAEJA